MPVWLSRASQIETKSTEYLPCERCVLVTTMKRSHDDLSVEIVNQTSIVLGTPWELLTVRHS